MRKERKIKFKREKKRPHNSLQIWYEGDEAAKLSLDVNIWREKKFWRKVYIDFGLKVHEVKKVKKIFIYFPFKIKLEEIKDLGGAFSDIKVISAVFNKNYGLDSSTEKNIVVKNNETGEVVFSIYQLDINADLAIENNYGGSVVSFAVKPQNDYDRYFRFRIRSKKYGTFIEKYKPKNSFFESAFIETELLDFRINERRNQDPTLMEEINGQNQFNLCEINFFVMSPIQDEIVSDGNNLVYSRQLEDAESWENYLGFAHSRMSVYKCIILNELGEIDAFCCFCKINYRKSNPLTIIKYLLVLCLLTIIFNLCSNCIWHYIEPVEWREDQNG